MKSEDFEILQIIPATNWFAEIETRSLHLISWALVEHRTTKARRVMGVVYGSDPGPLGLAELQPGFKRYFFRST
jgi:hypothetical protein